MDQTTNIDELITSLQITTLQDLEDQNDVICLYGNSGVGKSLLAAQFPKPLILACDPGLRGGMPRTADKYNPNVIIIKSFPHFVGTLQKVKPYAGKLYETLVVDSISFLTNMCLANIMSVVGREIPKFDEWNLNAGRMRKLLISICETPATIVITGLEGTVKDEVTGKITGGVDLPGKLAGEFPRHCTVVARLFVRTSYDKNGALSANYFMTTVGDDTWYAKDRTGLLPSVMPTSFDGLKILFKKEN